MYNTYSIHTFTVYIHRHRVSFHDNLNIGNTPPGPETYDVEYCANNNSNISYWNEMFIESSFSKH